MTNILLSIALCAVGGGAFIAGCLLLDQTVNQVVEKQIITSIV